MSISIMWRIGVCLRTNCIRTLPFFLAVLLISCQPPDVVPRRATVIRIAGATAMQPVLYELTTAFNRQHPTVFFEVAGGGSTTGEERVMAQQIDLAASTLLSPTVASVGNQGALSRVAIRTPIGIDGLAIIVHPNNMLTKLTLAQLQAIYNGRVLAWDEVGGSPGEVLLISREEGSGSRQLFDARVIGEERVSLTAVVMPTSKDVVDYVAAHPVAIGYVSRAYVTAAIEQAGQTAATTNTAGQPAAAPTVKVILLEEQLPTQQALQTQSYPLLQVLYFVTYARPTGALQQFIDFTLSPAGQTLVARYHGRVR